MKRLSAASSALVLLTLVGCGGGSEAALPPRDVTATPNSTPSPSPSRSATAAPEGMRLITARESGLRLAAPRSWTLIDASRLDDPSLKPRMKKMAQSMNVTLEQFRQMMAQIDLMAIAPAARLEQYGDLNVVSLKVLAEIPSREAIRADFRSMNMAVLGFDDVATPVGDGLMVTVRKAVPGLGTAYAQGLFVQMASGIVNVTVTHGTRSRAEDLMEAIIPTLEDIGPQEGSGDSVEG